MRRGEGRLSISDEMKGLATAPGTPRVSPFPQTKTREARR